MSLGEKKPKPNSRCRIKRRGGSCDCGRYGKKPVKAPYYSTVENEPEFLKRVVKWKRLNERRKHKKKGELG